MADGAFRRLDRDRHQRTAILVPIAERAEPEPPPQIKVAELNGRAALEVTGEQPDAHVAVRLEGVQDARDSRQHPRALQRVPELDRQVREVGVAQPIERGLAPIDAKLRECFEHNRTVRPAGECHARQRVLVTVQVPERGVHATHTSPSRVNQRSVDIEERQTTNPNRRSHHRVRIRDMGAHMISRRHLAGTAAAISTAALVTVAIAAAPPQMRASAEIKGDNISGTAELREVDAMTGAHDMKFMTGMKAVEITVTVTGLKPGAHGLHLHAVGKCETPGFTSAGGHFDPGPNSAPDPDTNHPFHMGDLPNLMADASGKATIKATTNRVTLGDGPLSVFDADGTAIIIHANPDQGVTAETKAGLSGGPRAACGVLMKR